MNVSSKFSENCNEMEDIFHLIDCSGLFLSQALSLLNSLY